MSSAEVFFSSSGDGQRFCIFHPANGAGGAVPHGQVVYVHPFAEEMNKSRRMAAMQSRSLAAAGFDVLQIDLLGCGDSSGDFGDATWSAWVDDIVGACQWLRARQTPRHSTAPHPPLWLWGLRAGCLLAVQASAAMPEPCHFLFWAPTPSGKTVVQQFLRLKAAADMSNGNAKLVMDGLRADLIKGQSVEVAGYRLSAELLGGIEQATLRPPMAAAAVRRMIWIDVSMREDAALSPVALKALEEWSNAGHHTESHVVHGPAFWQTTEIEDAPELIKATTAALLEAVST